MSPAPDCLTVACDKVPLLAPQESTITLSTASTVVQANGTTEIRADGARAERHARSERHNRHVHHESRHAVADGSAHARMASQRCGSLAMASPERPRSRRSLEAPRPRRSKCRSARGAAAASWCDRESDVSACGGESQRSRRPSPTHHGNPLIGVPVTFSDHCGSLQRSIGKYDRQREAAAYDARRPTRDATVDRTAGAGTSTVGDGVSDGRPAVRYQRSPVTPDSPTEGQPVTYTIGITVHSGALRRFSRMVVDFGDGTNSRSSRRFQPDRLAHLRIHRDVYT